MLTMQLWLQVTQLLFDAYWKQWVGDTQTLLQGLGEALAKPHQASPLTAIFERWFLLLKVVPPTPSLPAFIQM